MWTFWYYTATSNWLTALKATHTCPSFPVASPAGWWWRPGKWILAILLLTTIHAEKQIKAGHIYLLTFSRYEYFVKINNTYVTCMHFDF